MKIGKEILYLSRVDVENVGLSMGECIDILETAHKAKGNKMVEMPPKPRLGDPQTYGFAEAFPARILDTDCVGVKWLGGCNKNAGCGLPSITGLIVLNDPVTWCPVAVMDCAYITGLRTAGMSGIVLRHMANPDAEVVTVLGCGLQGRTNLAAVMSECPNVKRVYAWGPRMATVERYAAEMREKHGVEVIASANPRQAVREADILLSATPFGPPESFHMIHGDWLKEGVTAVPVSGGNHFFKDALLAFDKFFIDDTQLYQELHSREGVRMPIASVPPELSDFLTGRVPGRETSQERIFLMTGGLGINDISLARRIYELALEQEVGTMLSL